MTGVPLSVRGHSVPTVSMLVVTFNNGDEIDNCLAAALAQDDGGQHIEVVVVDNASTDDTAERVRTYGDKVRLITNPANVGFAAAMNQAAESAVGEFLLLLNPDCVMDEGCATALWQHLVRNPGVGLAAARLRNPDGTPQAFARRWSRAGELFWTFTDVGTRIDHRFRGGRHAAHREYQRELGMLAPDDPALVVDCPAASCVMLPASLAAPRLFDPQLPLFFNDAELASRLQHKGYLFHVVPPAGAVHEGGTTHRRVGRARRRAEFVAAMRRYCRSRHSTTFNLALLLVLLIDCAASAALCLVPGARPRAFANLRGVLGGLGIPKLGAKPWLSKVASPSRQLTSAARRSPAKVRSMMRGAARRTRRRRFLVRLRLSAWLVGARVRATVAKTADIAGDVELEIRRGTRATLAIGAFTRVQRGVVMRLDDGGDLDIGDYVDLRRGTTMNVKGTLRFARRNVIGAGTGFHADHLVELAWGAGTSERATIVDTTHDSRGIVHTLDDPVTGAPITLAPNVWVAAGAVVTAGISVGKATIVGANAVVTRDLPGGVVAAGAPAKPIRPLAHYFPLDD